MYITSSRIRKTIPSKHSLLFNKTKHSDEWHQTIDVIAGVLHPTDPKFPYPLLQHATDLYIKKKGKIAQADIDIRLAVLIDAHAAKDIAVAAAAHVMTAGSLRAVLHVDLNVAPGSYWGLDIWLQCLIAANYENPASVTDLEAIWARHLLPFATHGPGAAGKVLIGISRALRETATPNMNMVPDFLSLTSRAVTDYGAHLEGLRLKNNWTAAYGASYWMAELSSTSPTSTPPGHLLSEHILDAQFPVWRVWANWRPNLGLVQMLSSVDANNAAILADLLAMEGPDFINGIGTTLREGLIEQYEPGRDFLKFGRLLIEVSTRTQEGLRKILNSAFSTLGSILTTLVPVHRGPLFKFYTEVVIARPMTEEALDLVQAVLFISGGMKSGLGSDVLDAVLLAYTLRHELDGSHIRELQDLIQLFDRNFASNLRRILFTPALLQGITRCIQDGQTAVCTLMEQDQQWTELAVELHTFCAILKDSKNVPIVGEKIMESMCLLLPSTEHIRMALDMYNATQDRTMFTSCQTTDRTGSTKGDTLMATPAQFAAAAASLDCQKDESLNNIGEIVKEYILHRLLSRPAPGHTSQKTFELMLRIWEGKFAGKVTQNRRSLALLVADLTRTDPALRLRCLTGIATTDEQLSPGLSVQEILAILQDIDKNLERSVVKLIRLLASCPATQDFKAQIRHWRDLAYDLLARQSRPNVPKGLGLDLLEYVLRTMNASEWLSFLADTQLVFVSGPSRPLDENDVPPILRPELHRHWAELTPYSKTLARLDEVLGDKSQAMRGFLGCSGAQSHSIIVILQTLEALEQEPVGSFLCRIASLLSADANNASLVLQCVSIVSDASTETQEVCKKIWDAKHGFLMIPRLSNSSQKSGSGDENWLKPVTILDSTAGRYTTRSVDRQSPANRLASKYDVPASVVEVMVAGWLLDDKAPEDTKAAVRAIASLLSIVQTDHGLSKDKLMEAAAFWHKIEDELIQEANRLEALRKALKTRDPQGTALLLQQAGVPDTTEMDDEISQLPAEVLNVVERIDDKEVEITFSLATFTQLQRAAMGIPEAANTLSLQLFIDHKKKSPPAFCLHYDTDQHLETLAHTRCICSADSENPTAQICTSAQTAFTWQLSRIIFSKLRRGQTSILNLHQSLVALLPDLAQFCVSCSASHDSKAAQIRRSIPCNVNLHSCAELWYALPLHIRIPEIRTDTFAVDMALSSVYAAAVANKSELLQGCPIRTFSGVRSILNDLPSMNIMRDAVNLSAVLRSYNAQAEELISWAVIQHRGFLATARGLLKIPNLPPGTHQFVLANASPKIESSFARRAQASNQDTTVLFHGTSIDRLPAILAKGLRIYSGTPLQRTGAAHGKGIYLSEDPATSFYYSTASLSWKASGLNMMRMMLGCELVGTASKVSGNIHVVTDVESVMVRYILLFPRDARMPIRGHVEPAMASGMKALRSGVV